MSDVEEILRESIKGQCGLGGLMRFNALYTGGFETADGRPDLAGIDAAVSGTFPAGQASAIMAEVRKKLEPGRPSGKAMTIAMAGSHGGEGQEAPATFARYFNADPNHVRDIVHEARCLRVAMGKSMPSQWATHPDSGTASAAPVTNTSAEKALADKATGISKESTEPAKTPQANGPVEVMSPASQANPTEPQSEIDREVRKFAYGRTACTSIDIIDFIRCLKDKGYSLQEYIVLEKIYVTIEERKKEARFAIESEIEGLIDATQAPEEPDIRGLLQRLCESGLVFEEEDVRRKVREAVLRRASLLNRAP